MITPEKIFRRILEGRLNTPKTAEAFAPSNIALSKYWGKRDRALNLPLNSSLSISLGNLGTETRITPSDQDCLVFNRKTLQQSDPTAVKLWKFVDLFRGPNGPRLSIKTENSIPTAAGLASSASGFAALSLALNQAFNANLDKKRLSILARLGSGSATRSLWHGFVRWDKGEQPDGSDSHGHPINTDYQDMRIAIVTVDAEPKAKSSRDGMNHTASTSPLFHSWPEQAEKDCKAIETSLLKNDFTKLGRIAEANALAMHATMMAARPSLNYLKSQSWQILEKLWVARMDGLEAYATIDAGANIKLIFEKHTKSDLCQTFPTATVINPFNSTEQMRHPLALDATADHVT